jgi:predicted nucleic acid-binding protein
VRWYFDTSVLVAAAVDRHEHNSRALGVLESMHLGKHHGYLSTHSLTGIYSVLTRTPFRPAVRPADALKAIEDQVLSCMTLVSLDETEYVDIVRRAANEGWIGGRIHDAIQLQCAAKMKCDRVYTFHVRDFRAVASERMSGRITAP